VRDAFGNAATAPEGALSADHAKPGYTLDLTPLDPPKMKGGLGAYEVSLEPTKSGTHVVHIRLHGHEITGSPVSFAVAPAAPHPNKCKLVREFPPEPELPVEKTQAGIRVTLFDKYGNQLDRGGVRVDAKALGAMVSQCTVEDHKDGTYTISLSAGAPGEVKVVARIDGTEIAPMPITFVKAAQVDAVQAEGPQELAKEGTLDVKKPAVESKPVESKPRRPSSADGDVQLQAQAFESAPASSKSPMNETDENPINETDE